MHELTVVGAGLAGLTAALRLSAAGYRVRVFERYSKPGGLARTFSIGGEPIESFYHHLFATDTAYVALAEELGLGSTIEWLPSRMGIWTGGRLWDFGTPGALLRFTPLRAWDKIRFVVSTLHLQHSHDAGRFENVTAAEWLRRHQGRRAWQNIWAPLLEQKFACEAERVAMVWLWRKLYLRGRSRSRSGMGERLGYMKGSFSRLVDRLRERLIEQRVELHLGDAVRSVDRLADGFRVHTTGASHLASRVVVATPVADYLQVAGHLLPPDHAASLRKLRSTAAMCTILELDRQLTPYYWLNIADGAMPFGGLIEHTNYISAERYGGRRILYISNYLLPDHPLYQAPKEIVLEAYLPALGRVNPGFRAEHILAAHHFRADSAQPVVTVGYRDQIPAMRTPLPGLYLCTMAQVYPEDRGQNYAVQYGGRVARCVIEDDLVSGASSGEAP